MRIVLQKVSEGSVDVVDETSGEVDTTFEPQHIGIGYVRTERNKSTGSPAKSPTCAFSKTRTAK